MPVHMATVLTIMELKNSSRLWSLKYLTIPFSMYFVPMSVKTIGAAIDIILLSIKILKIKLNLF